MERKKRGTINLKFTKGEDEEEEEEDERGCHIQTRRRGKVNQKGRKRMRTSRGVATYLQQG